MSIDCFVCLVEFQFFLEQIKTITKNQKQSSTNQNQTKKNKNKTKQNTAIS